jgi:hypothetical protein
MKRVDIEYFGKSYTLPNTSAEQVRHEVEEGFSTGKPFWLRVNQGEGKPQPVDLLLTLGVGFTVADANVDEESGDIVEPRGLFDTETHVVPPRESEDVA